MACMGTPAPGARWTRTRDQTQTAVTASVTADSALPCKSEASPIVSDSAATERRHPAGATLRPPGGRGPRPPPAGRRGRCGPPARAASATAMPPVSPANRYRDRDRQRHSECHGASHSWSRY
jgi:hypothetical protein